MIDLNQRLVKMIRSFVHVHTKGFVIISLNSSFCEMTIGNFLEMAAKGLIYKPVVHEFLYVTESKEKKKIVFIFLNIQG